MEEGLARGTRETATVDTNGTIAADETEPFALDARMTTIQIDHTRVRVRVRGNLTNKTFVRRENEKLRLTCHRCDCHSMALPCE